MPRVSAREGDVLVTVIHGGLDAEVFRENAFFRTRIEKYATRPPKAVTIGIDQRDVEKPFELALWMEGAWEHDELLENLVTEDRARPKKLQLLKKGKKFGRNDPCPCGSGKKLKRCCIDRLKFV